MKIISQGRTAHHKTEEFQCKKEKIIGKINEKYADLIVSEKNPFKKIMLILKKRKELRAKLNDLTSREILYSHSN